MGKLGSNISCFIIIFFLNSIHRIKLIQLNLNGDGVFFFFFLIIIIWKLLVKPTLLMRCLIWWKKIFRELEFLKFEKILFFLYLVHKFSFLMKLSSLNLRKKTSLLILDFLSMELWNKSLTIWTKILLLQKYLHILYKGI